MAENYLRLGWKVNAYGDPKYWMDQNAEVGNQTDSNLIMVPASSIAAHTAIIAQSGSGKSYFLGRLIEEIAMNTKARCLILDPNSDFKKLSQVVDRKLWKNAKYDIKTRKGFLPHEKSYDDFHEEWKKISKKNRVSDDFDEHDNSCYEKLFINWFSISMELISEGLDTELKSSLYHCHVFTSSIAYLFSMESFGIEVSSTVFNEAEKFLKLPINKLEDDLQSRFGGDEFINNYFLKRKFSTATKIRHGIYVKRVKNRIDKACQAKKYITKEAIRYYFGKAEEYLASGIIKVNYSSSYNSLSQIEVIDLPSIPDSDSRYLSVSSILESEWDEARYEWNEALLEEPEKDKRVPTLIIIDEAHNLIPARPKNQMERIIQDQFRRIIAEGRKYGLFLLLVSQRPDKLDPLVLSECENIAIMKLSTISVLNKAKQLLALDDIQPKLLDKCVEFAPGRGILLGKWSETPQMFYCAARRTIEGGRNLREEYWANKDD